ncbi:MAG: DNA translocase FtsK [Flavobacteriales bacterium]|nr:DNA translocase FtsK [Flavobacteriales bacterium]
MPVANERKNRVRSSEDDAPVETPKRATKRNKPRDAGPGWWSRTRAFVADRRTHKVFGLFLVLLSGYLLVAFVSYLFTWRADQDLTNRSWGALLSREVEADNWLGKLGALVSHQFIRSWFGVAAFVFVLWSFLGGLRILVGSWLLPVRRTLTWSAVTLFWLPAALAFAFRSGELAFLGGALGYTVNGHLTGLLGNFGAAALLLFSLGAVLTAVFDPNFSWLATLMQRRTAAPVERAVTEEPVEIKANRVRTETVSEPAAPATEPVAEVMGTDRPDEAEVEELEEVVEEPEPTLEEEIGMEVEGLEPAAGLELDVTPSPPDELPADPILPAVPIAVDGMSVVAAAEDKVLTEDQIEAKLQEFGEYDPTLDLSSYELPPLDLLVDHGTGEVTVTKEELEANKDRIVATLGHYNIGIDKIKATIGPTVTLYEIIPQAGVRISKIKNLEDDIALSLAALGIRIIAPIPGKGTIGIEVPNSRPQVVGMRAVVASEKFQNTSMDLPIVLGKTISNETFVTDLSKMPHLLMAGATGQGKSVGLNAILVSLLYKKHPSQIKFVLVDPKKVELTLFNKIERHFLAKLPGEGEAIITDTKKVVATLNSLCIEMDERYELLKDAQVRNIKEYNSKFIQRRLNPENGHRYLPYIVLVVDEFADLIMTAGREVETPIARLAQLARAIGIHLIIATQRPSVNIITGTIKANFPARIAFRVTSKVDSRTILDSGGAEQLIGRGDMLLSTGNDLIRIQCAFVDTPEVDKICDFIGAQRGYPDALILPEVPTEEGGELDVDDGERDSMFEEAARLVVQTQQGSTSLIQRKLKLGYNRAGRIVDQLEAAGVLGPFEGSKARRVMIPNEAALAAHLNQGVAAGPGVGGF